MDASSPLEGEVAQREQRAQRRAELVGGRLAHGGEAPVVAPAPRRGTRRGASGCCRRRRRGARGGLCSRRHAGRPLRHPRLASLRRRRGRPAREGRAVRARRLPPAAQPACPSAGASAAPRCRASCSPTGRASPARTRSCGRSTSACRSPPLLPPSGDERRPAVERAATWGEEVLQPLARRLIWAALRRDPGAMLSYGGRARPPLPRALARLARRSSRAPSRRSTTRTTPPSGPT